MKIMGKEYGLRYTVGAQEEIAALKDDPELGKIKVTAQIPLILSKWHEKAESLLAKEEGREYEPQPLDYETVQHLTQLEFDELLRECERVRKRDSERTVEEAAPAEAEKKTDEAAAG